MKSIQGKKFSILGLGRTGYHTALFLARRGGSVFLTESRKNLRKSHDADILRKCGVEVEIGLPSRKRIEESDYIVVSPGISPQESLMKDLKNSKEKWISEIELASWFCPGKIIAITGTNGKTTVTTLTYQLLKAAGFEVFKCGNIGIPFISIVEKVGYRSFVVLELSSFQLFYTKSLAPYISVVLNLAPDHFDWHKDFNEYAFSKTKIYKNLSPTDYALINQREQQLLKYFPKASKGKKIFFNNSEEKVNPNFSCLEKMSQILKIDKKVFLETLENFDGIEHRLEHVCIQEGITFINDSKSTSPHSLEWALNQIKAGVILICGGRNKGLNFADLVPQIKKKVKLVITIGEAQNEIANAFSSVVSVFKVNELKDAILKSKEMAKKDDVVLFSPACSSFDMFKNYEDRGKKFKELVRKP